MDVLEFSPDLQVGVDPLTVRIRALLEALQVGPPSLEVLRVHARICRRIADALGEPVETIYETLNASVRPRTAGGARLLDFVTEEIYTAYWDDCGGAPGATDFTASLMTRMLAKGTTDAGMAGRGNTSLSHRKAA